MKNLQTHQTLVTLVTWVKPLETLISKLKVKVNHVIEGDLSVMVMPDLSDDLINYRTQQNIIEQYIAIIKDDTSLSLETLKKMLNEHIKELKNELVIIPVTQITNIKVKQVEILTLSRIYKEYVKLG